MEQLSAIEAASMAMGSADDPARQERLDKLRAIARGDQTDRGDRARRKMANPDQAAAMGMGVIMVPPAPQAEASANG